jgi:hypothetical protein
MVPRFGPIGTGPVDASRSACSAAASRAKAMRVPALEQALEKLRRANGTARALTLAELVEQYLAQHEAAPVTLVAAREGSRRIGDCSLGDLRPAEIAAWRMTIPAGYRFEATQALRQVLARAVVWGMLEVNPAKQGVENPQRRRTEKRPFDSWEELEAPRIYSQRPDVATGSSVRGRAESLRCSMALP